MRIGDINLKLWYKGSMLAHGSLPLSPPFLSLSVCPGSRSIITIQYMSDKLCNYACCANVMMID